MWHYENCNCVRQKKHPDSKNVLRIINYKVKCNLYLYFVI